MMKMDELRKKSQVELQQSLDELAKEMAEDANDSGVTIKQTFQIDQGVAINTQSHYENILSVVYDPTEVTNAIFTTNGDGSITVSLDNGDTVDLDN